MPIVYFVTIKFLYAAKSQGHIVLMLLEDVLYAYVTQR